MSTEPTDYAIRLDIDYPEKLDRVTSFFRWLWAIPILIVFSALSATSYSTMTVVSESGDVVSVVGKTGGGIVAGLALATGLMVLFRQRYPRWWFDFAKELTRFTTRIGAYLTLLTDEYPSTVEEQTVHLDIDYPDAEEDLNRWMPLVKWFLAIPHYIVVVVLVIGAMFAIFFAWFAILFTGRYPRSLFDYVVGVTRWALRVEAYVVLLITDEYPPFSLR